MEKINKDLIAACGMNCGVCLAHLRENNQCKGCRKVTADCPKSRFLCKIRTCKERKGDYCFDCNKFPCERLKNLDKRYRTKYGMSQIENLEFIRDNGIEELLKSERSKWQSTMGILCVHDKKHY